MTSTTLFVLFDASNKLIAFSNYISADAVVQDFRHKLQYEFNLPTGVVYACRMSEAAAVEIKSQKDMQKAASMCKLYSHSMTHCMDVTT